MGLEGVIIDAFALEVMKDGKVLHRDFNSGSVKCDGKVNIRMGDIEVDLS